MNNQYYDGTKLLSLMDRDGRRPEIYICTSNRSAGKTTYFARLCVNRFLAKNEKFCLLYRFKYELTHIADKFFKDIHELFFPDYTMSTISFANGSYHELYLAKNGRKEKNCGYALAINNADQIKLFSHLLTDVERIFFDEFQSENNHYCPNEVIKYQSIHVSLARGRGKMSRYVPVYMVANPVTLLNPYYTAMDISTRLTPSTVYLRGAGYVLEQAHSDAAREAQQASGFNRAFAHNSYMDYAYNSCYLNDNSNFLERIKGTNKYLCTVKYKNKNYALREYTDLGVIYCSDKPDLSYPYKIAVTTDDHNINYVLLKHYNLFITNLRYFFDHGCFRFQNLACKEAIIKMLSY